MGDLERDAPDPLLSPVAPDRQDHRVVMPGRSRWIRTALAATVFLWSLSAWCWSGLLAGQRAARLIEREQVAAQIGAEAIGENISRRLDLARGIPIVMAKEPSLVALLNRFGPNAAPSHLAVAEQSEQWRADPALRDLSRHLGEIVAETGLNTLFVMNAAGDCIAEGRSPENSDFTGVNYADRDYFQAARNGRNGRQYAIGRVTNFPGLFFSTPVFSEGQFVGAVGARINLASLSRLVTEKDAFVTDDRGVIILTQDLGLLMRTLPGAPIADVAADERERRYKRVDFEAINLTPWKEKDFAGLMRWRDKIWPCVLARQTSPEGLVTVHVFRDLEELGDFQRERLWLFGLLVLTGLLVVLLVAGGGEFLQASRRHRDDLMRLNEHLARQASTDPLTGCANRRRFHEVLEAEWQRWNRYGCQFSVLSLDLDHFKRVNDRYGHPCGDQLLRHFVAVIESILRPTDILGRMGGEEFAVLLPQTNVWEAASIAERIRATLEAQPSVIDQKAVPLTVSIGVAEWRADRDVTVSDLLGRGDKALYKAKRAGRNRVSGDDGCAPPPFSPSDVCGMTG
ncbi:diguanylate cyclase [Telmatospirillum sp.]|uniref:sensor domain-containing diguanylate cyclase n=1 Tax=Telmatospirillum sp. TaxID=2079197 RepID=UPI00284A0E23|nr:diguanylate cyclase [Telmatospirillum sp.]MDR3436146.1 diguanylate cyclase [Telmatospirillum sp.]